MTNAHCDSWCSYWHSACILSFGCLSLERGRSWQGQSHWSHRTPTPKELPLELEPQRSLAMRCECTTVHQEQDLQILQGTVPSQHDRQCVWLFSISPHCLGQLRCWIVGYPHGQHTDGQIWDQMVCSRQSSFSQTRHECHSSSLGLVCSKNVLDAQRSVEEWPLLINRWGSITRIHPVHL